MPAGLRHIVAHCLEKEAGQRFQSAKDLGFALTQGATQTGSAPALGVRRRNWRWPAIAFAFAVLGAVAGMFLRQAPVPPHWSGVMLGGTSVASYPRLSPDGQTLAFQAIAADDVQVAITTPASGDIAILTHSAENGYVQQICWSRDGTRIYYDRYTDVPRGI